jgi:dynactin 5
MASILSTSADAGAAAAATGGGEDGGYIQTAMTGSFVSRNGTVIDGPGQVELNGRCVLHGGVRIRGDLARIRIGRYCTVRDNTTLQPPPVVPAPVSEPPAAAAGGGGGDTATTKTTPSSSTIGGSCIPMSIGSYTIIGQDCRILAASIGSMCQIGNGCILGPRCIIKDCCVLPDNTTIPADVVIPPFTRVTSSSFSSSASSSSAVATSSGGITAAVEDMDGRFHRRRNRIITTELPPAVSVILQEQAVERYDAFLEEQQ